MKDAVYSWSELKRSQNLKKHGLDFRDAHLVFQGPTCVIVDERFDYRERRYISIGLLHSIPVVVAHTETESEVRIISFRKATANEAKKTFN